MFRKPRIAKVRAGGEAVASAPCAPRPPTRIPLSRRHALYAVLAAGAFGFALVAGSSDALPNAASRYDSSSAAAVDLPDSFLSDEPYGILAPRFLQDPRLAARLAARPEYIWPVDGWITTLFSGEHPGVDVGFEQSPPVRAAREGVVAYVGGDPCCGKGLFVIVWHDDGWSTLYGHLSEFRAEVGDKVRQGDTIGIGGSTGNSTGPHVHLELLQNGSAVDPMAYFPPDIEIRLEPDATETPTETGTPGTPDAEAIETPDTPGGRRPTQPQATVPAPPSATAPPAPPTATPPPTVPAGPP